MTASFTINFLHDGDVCYLGKSMEFIQKNGGKIQISLLFFSSLPLPLHLFTHEGQFGYDIKQSSRKYVFEN